MLSLLTTTVLEDMTVDDYSRPLGATGIAPLPHMRESELPGIASLACLTGLALCPPTRTSQCLSLALNTELPVVLAHSMALINHAGCLGGRPTQPPRERWLQPDIYLAIRDTRRCQSALPCTCTSQETCRLEQVSWSNTRLERLILDPEKRATRSEQGATRQFEWGLLPERDEE